MPKTLKFVVTLGFLPLFLAACGVRGALEAPPTSKSDGGGPAVSKSDGGATAKRPKPHKPFILDDVLR